MFVRVDRRSSGFLLWDVVDVVGGDVSGEGMLERRLGRFGSYFRPSVQ